MRKPVVIVFSALVVLSLVAAGCGSKPVANVAGKKYLNSLEEADSRTIQFNTNGTFDYMIGTTEMAIWHHGTYTVADGKVTLTFEPQGQITELAGKTIQLEASGNLLLDPDGSKWEPM